MQWSLQKGARVARTEGRFMEEIATNPKAEEAIEKFLVETGVNEAMRNENMKCANVEELAAVAKRYGFEFTAADMIRHQAKTILTFTDQELVIYFRSQPWWQLCLQAYSLYGR
ncbi:MAG: Nif11-like leader peptide family natural product precursor [Leptospirales bacterium]|jgi:hypothetical protein